MPVAGKLCVIGKIVLRRNRIVIQRKGRGEEEEEHYLYDRMIETKRNLRTKVWWPGVDKAILP